jgi:hypothetical protein
VTYRISFAAIPGILEPPCKRMLRGVLLDQGGGRILGTVIDDQNLDRSVALAELRQLGQCSGETGSLVIGRHHDRKPGQNSLYASYGTIDTCPIAVAGAGFTGARW